MIPYPNAVKDAWLPVCTVKDIKHGPVRRRLHGKPLVIFQSDGGPAILSDRCPHRNVPLSDGHVRNGTIVCPYHGWAFAGDGTCVDVPGTGAGCALRAESCAMRVENGLIFANTSPTPRAFIPLPAPVGQPGFDHHIWTIGYQGSLIDGMENFLDPTHPHLMHTRIVGRNPQRVEVTVVRRLTPTSIECEYQESTRRRGWLPALLEGARQKGVGRFYGPTTCQIGLFGEKEAKIFITAVFSPQTIEEIQGFVIFSTPKGWLPPWLKGIALEAFNRKILREDQAMMRRQLENLHVFEAPKYALGPLDFIKPSMVKLMNEEQLVPGEETLTCWL